MKKAIYKYTEFLSIGPAKVTRYVKNMAPDTKNYYIDWVNKGATILPDGSLDISLIPKNLTDSNKHKGIISIKSNRQIQNIIDWMILITKNKDIMDASGNYAYSFKINFITLTLSSKQMHSDKFLMNNLFQPLLDTLRKNYGIKHYFWRAETQANGNLHFHLCTDCFIPWLYIRNRWNYLQNKLGYIDEFFKNNNHNQPNSIDVHSIKAVKNIGAYLSKYCGKNSKGVQMLQFKYSFPFSEKTYLFLGTTWKKPKKNCLFFRPVYCKLWGASQSLSRLKTFNVVLAGDVEIDFKKIVANKKIRDFKTDFCTCYFISPKDYKQYDLLAIRRLLLNHILDIKPIN